MKHCNRIFCAGRANKLQASYSRGCRRCSHACGNSISTACVKSYSPLSFLQAPSILCCLWRSWQIIQSADHVMMTSSVYTLAKGRDMVGLGAPQAPGTCSHHKSISMRSQVPHFVFSTSIHWCASEREALSNAVNHTVHVRRSRTSFASPFIILKVLAADIRFNFGLLL